MPYRKLKLSKFGAGMIDEDQISRLEHPVDSNGEELWQGACTDCQNVVWMPSGAMTKRKGLDKLHTTAWKNSAITRIYQWRATTGADHSMVFSCVSGAVSASIATVATTGTYAEFSSITDGLTAWNPEYTDPVSVTTFCGSAIMTHWGNPQALFTWEPGNSTMNTLTAGPSGAKIVVGFGNYLFACNVQDDVGVQQRSRIQWCASRTPTNWPATYYIDLDADDGDQITGAFVFENTILVFKQYKIYSISWVGGSYLFKETLVDNAIGMVGPNAWIGSESNIYFIGSCGIYKYDDRGTAENICSQIQSTVNRMNMAICQIFDADCDDNNWQIWFNLVLDTGTRKDLILCYDTRFKSWTKFDIAAACLGGIDYGANTQYIHLGQSYSSYSMRIRDAVGEKQGILCIGTHDGYLVRFGQESNDYGTAIDGYWTSRWIDFGDPTVNKRIVRVTVLLERYEDYNLNFELYVDWDGETAVQTKVVSLGGSADVHLIEKKIDFTQACRSAQIKVSTNEISSPFIVHRLVIEYLVKGRTLVVS